MGDRYLNSLQLVQNAVSWGTEDTDLLTIRTRGTTARVLKVLTERTQSMWELANYAVALLALVAIAAIWNLRRQSQRPLELLPPETIAPARQEVQA